MTINRRWTLARRPEGRVGAADFLMERTPLDKTPPEAGGIVVRNRVFSVAPAIRNRLKAPEASHRGAIPIGGVIGGMAACEVIASAHADYPVGRRIVAMSQWEDVSRLYPDRSPVPPFPITDQMTIEDALGVCSPNSLTAYFGMIAIGRPIGGETVLVSGAAGSVGSIACQIARISGARVIGIAGGEDKCAWLRGACGVDATIDYRSEDLRARLAELAPKGIDVFFDNVGGEILQAAVDHMARHGRIVLCGQISAYDRDGTAPGPRDMMKIVYGSLRVQGFVVGDFIDQAAPAQQQLREWAKRGDLVVKTDIRRGIEQLPAAFVDLFSGANQGALLVTAD